MPSVDDPLLTIRAHFGAWLQRQRDHSLDRAHDAQLHGRTNTAFEYKAESAAFDDSLCVFYKMVDDELKALRARQKMSAAHECLHTILAECERKLPA
jgi:hypothetical protein